MNEKAFWDIIAAACYNACEEHLWEDRLADLLRPLGPELIVEWNHIFDRLAGRAHTRELWAACGLINGTWSHDPFYYFRCWLICKGRDVYESAVADADTLADIVDPAWDAMLEVYAVAHHTWMEVTGKGIEDDYPARKDFAPLKGDIWDHRADSEIACRLPRLSALYRGTDPS